MASTITRIKTIRIKNETADYFEKKPLNRIVEIIGEMMQAGKMSFDGETLHIKGVSGPKNDLESIEEMASLMNVSTEKLLSDFRELLEEGSLYYSGNRLVNPRYEELERACEGKNIDKIIESLIRSL